MKLWNAASPFGVVTGKAVDRRSVAIEHDPIAMVFGRKCVAGAQIIRQVVGNIVFDIDEIAEVTFGVTGGVPTAQISVETVF